MFKREGITKIDLEHSKKVVARATHIMKSLKKRKGTKENQGTDQSKN